MTLTFSVTNHATDDADRFQVSSFFDDGISEGGELMSTVDGVAVIDGQNAKRYLPARTADERCMCSARLSAAFVAPGQTLFLSAVYQAVPEAVTSVTVDIPKAGAFTSIPVSR